MPRNKELVDFAAASEIINRNKQASMQTAVQAVQMIDTMIGREMQQQDMEHRIEMENKKMELDIGDSIIRRQADQARVEESKLNQTQKLQEITEHKGKLADVSSVQQFWKTNAPLKQTHDKVNSAMLSQSLPTYLNALSEFGNGFTSEVRDVNLLAASRFSERLPGAPAPLATPEDLLVKGKTIFGKVTTQIRRITTKKVSYDTPTEGSEIVGKPNATTQESTFEEWDLADIPKYLKTGTIEQQREAIRILSGYNNSPADKDAVLKFIDRTLPANADRSALRMDRIDASLDTPNQKFLTDPKNLEDFRKAKLGVVEPERMIDPRDPKAGYIPRIDYRKKVEKMLSDESPLTQKAGSELSAPAPRVSEKFDPASFDSDVSIMVKNINDLSPADKKVAAQTILNAARNSSLNPNYRMRANAAARKLGYDQAQIDESGGVSEDWNTTLAPLMFVGGTAMGAATSFVGNIAGKKVALGASERLLTSPGMARWLGTVTKTTVEGGLDVGALKVLSESGVDEKGMALFSSGAVLGSVAEKFGAKAFKKVWPTLKLVRTNYVASGLAKQAPSLSSKRAINKFLADITKEHGLDVANTVLDLITKP